MRVLICGAGIAGLTLAFLLQRSGHRVILLEQAGRLRDEGYMMDFVGAGYDVCEKIGLLPELERIHYPIARLAFLDHSGREQAGVPYADIRRIFGGRHFNFMRGELEHVLYSQLANAADVHFGVTLCKVETGPPVRAHFSNGKTGEFDLLVGADGIHSRTRALVFGPEERYVRDLGYCAAAYTLAELPPRSMPLNRVSIVSLPGRMVTLYPIRGHRAASFFIFRARPGWQPAHGAPAIRDAFSGIDTFVPDLLDRMPEHPYVDSVSQVRLPAWSKNATVLVGDAAYCVSVIAGQGASLAVAGAYVLADELSSSPTDLQGALGRYEARMRPAVNSVQLAAFKIADWFVPQSRVRIAVRNAAMRALRLPGLPLLLSRLLAARRAVPL